MARNTAAATVIFAGTQVLPIGLPRVVVCCFMDITPGVYFLDETISLRQRHGCANNRAACGTYAHRWAEAFARTGILLVVWPQSQQRAVVARRLQVTH